MNLLRTFQNVLNLKPATFRLTVTVLDCPLTWSLSSFGFPLSLSLFIVFSSQFSSTSSSTCISAKTLPEYAPWVERILSTFDHSHMTTGCITSCYRKQQSINQLLWESAGSDVIIITLSQLRPKNKNYHITIREQNKSETCITQSVAREWFPTATDHTSWHHRTVTKNGSHFTALMNTMTMVRVMKGGVTLFGSMQDTKSGTILTQVWFPSTKWDFDLSKLQCRPS